MSLSTSRNTSVWLLHSNSRRLSPMVSAPPNRAAGFPQSTCRRNTRFKCLRLYFRQRLPRIWTKSRLILNPNSTALKPRTKRFLKSVYDEKIYSFSQNAASIPHFSQKVLFLFRIFLFLGERSPQNYLKMGYYPFFREDDFYTRLDNVVNQTLEVDIPTYANMNVATSVKLKGFFSS